MIRLRLIMPALILVFYCNSLTSAITISEIELNPAEKYVIEQLKNGKPSDFSEIQGGYRILSADFLKHLLTGSIQDLEMTEKGIHIYGARIEEKLDLRGEKINFPFSFIKL